MNEYTINENIARTAMCDRLFFVFNENSSFPFGFTR